MSKKQNRQQTKKQHYLLRWLVWMNIFTQIAFPAAVTFTPIAVAAETPIPENSTEHWLAGTASYAAGLLKSGNVMDSAKSQLRGMAVSEANQTVQNWLKHYGTAKIQANVDDRGRLDGSQFDMLLPLYDEKANLLFTQFGLRHIDSRTTANFGLGHRYFFDHGMLGYNAFLDHDITRDHTRLGLGAEYARDYLKFGANGYFRLSGWKEAKKLADYDERPANGFDLWAEGYLPPYPQLGGKLVYEQYFGDEVGLISEDRRQKNPSAFTVGANYTPIPLVTLGIDRKQSTSGGSETLFNLGLNYEIGTPWSKQVDPNAVASKRSLQGNRYDLVERNNQIVLEYRKREVIRLVAEALISGHGGEIKPLNVNVNSKYGLKEIVWNEASIIAAGGKLDKVNSSDTQYLLILPQYHVKNSNNRYILSGVAYDTQGNGSNRVEIQVQVISTAISVSSSGFEQKKLAMLANGKTQTKIRLVLKDSDNQPVTGAAGRIKLTDDKKELKKGEKDPVFGTDAKEIAPGIYELDITAGNREGTWEIIATVDSHELPPLTIEFNGSLSEMIDISKTKFAPEKKHLEKEDETTHLILELRDRDDNLITGVGNEITLTPDNREMYGASKEISPLLGELKEDPQSSGIYKARVIAGSGKGKWTVILSVGSKELSSAKIEFGTGGNGKGGVANPHTEPEITSLILTGNLEINNPLTARYTFDANGGDPHDQSEYIWHDKNTPVADDQWAKVPDASKDEKATTGTLTKDLKQEDAGKTLAVSIKPVNSKNIAGQYKTVDISMNAQDGNKTTPTGGKPGTILDPQGKPSIEQLILSGRLETGSALKATYVFKPGTGEAMDQSEYIWTRIKEDGDEEQIPHSAAKGNINGNSGEITSPVLANEDIGKQLKITITPINGRKMPGDPVSTNTGDRTSNQLDSGGDKGRVIDPDRSPIIENLEIGGTLEVGKQLTATYHFNANNGGHEKDNSIFAWGIKYPKADPNASKSPEFVVATLGDDPNHVINPAQTGTVPAYPLTDEHSGQVIQLAMIPRSQTGKKTGSQVNKDTTQQGNKLGGYPDGTVKGVASDFTVELSPSEANIYGNMAVRVKKGDTITLTIKATTKDGKAARAVPVTIETKAHNRQNQEETSTVTLDGKNGDYTAITPENGTLVIPVTDHGKGLKTTLIIKAYGVGKTETKNVIFTVLTSPDTDKAKYWGHMHDTISVGKLTFRRTPLDSEYPTNFRRSENNEVWGPVNLNEADTYCSNIGIGYRVPTYDEIIEIYHTYSTYKGEIRQTYGWPITRYYRTSTKPQATVDQKARRLVDIETGAEESASGYDGGGPFNKVYVSCVTDNKT
ncbi:inverse autotransporter beta domain-containing protein [Xenorhabdus bovienii]|uniref:inverse autotransporter beta domain-containing protein n=1 Tax=Xenorhabdus bovienii TaxID=40576 RepID=UPI00237CCB76|nr:inverse autotransporter beta domain-containing protein [Xenorhabdus bovienii]MDE1481685.1 inverse autotransporter beta domain-containing protein [Xenorhabdus bovienii]MDE9440512.1 inverse autotransporter beta domain-containing protein [Xenorhabdus bovienii]